ncbi:FMN reductase [Photobacterium aquae]|uniref:FMN reductase n=1 Tax=Photobacterium aquae TaxID=1195763 RepID=A0A0J1GUS0_9GAMM|nr:NAD(P)H-dependent oxidoreductase [Photobacterium aquae]KLV03174.1 FMN reductase [Photobacterium aquae]
MSHVLVISGHPNLESSNTNTVILNELERRIDSLEVRRLDSLYPDYQIDIAAEQQALLKADIIVLQFPFYWYSVPALLKKWIDDVFSYNFAYGSKGDKLKGKDFILSFTIGGPAESYDPLGYNHFTIEQIMHPLQQTAYLAGMNYQKPVYSHRMVYIPGVYNELTEVQDRAKAHAVRLAEQINTLAQSSENIIKQQIIEWFATMDKLPENTDSFTVHLANDLMMDMPEGTFNGVNGFRDWYGTARSLFKPGCTHTIEQIDIKPNGDRYEAELRVRLQADTQATSCFNGETINILVNETWQLSLNSEGKMIIHQYHVEPVAG